MADRLRHRKPHRVRRGADFRRAYAQGRWAGNHALAVYVVENGLGWSRVGLSVGRRVGKAIQRNRLRRRLREVFRLMRPTLPSGLDIIFVARGLPQANYHDLARRVTKLVAKALARPCLPR